MAKTQLYQNQEVYITGIDMFLAFDTLKRYNLIDELETCLNEDESRMARLLINTTINIQFGNSKNDDISTNVGSPQGDAISGRFFNMAIEKSLKSLRAKSCQQNPHLEPEDTPANYAMQYYFEKPQNAKKYSGNPRRTLPISINQHINNALKRPITQDKAFYYNGRLDKPAEICPR